MILLYSHKPMTVNLSLDFIDLPLLKVNKECTFHCGCKSQHVFFPAQVPLVPLTPAASILINVFLMMKLSFLTWIRFSIWIAIGKKTHKR